MENIEHINALIREITIRNIYATWAIIIFNERGSALMMPTGGEGSDGKRYRIWPNLSSLEEAKSIAKEWGNHMPQIQFAYQEEKEIPDDPEILLCNHFLLKFM